MSHKVNINKKTARKNNKIFLLKQNIINQYKQNLFELLSKAGAKLTLLDVDLLIKNNINELPDYVSSCFTKKIKEQRKRKIYLVK